VERSDGGHRRGHGPQGDDPQHEAV
jgi:hypothetical protein